MLTRRHAYVDHRSFSLFAGKSGKGKSEDRLKNFDLLSPEELAAAAMEDRLDEANKFVSKKLSDDEAAILNKALGIESLLEAEEDDEEDTKSKKNKRKKLSSTEKDAISKIMEDAELRESTKIKGFLEMNPSLCSGCGSAFQVKNPENPGFLPREKFTEHQRKAEMIRKQQEAIKILNFAGIDVDSEAAGEILRDAGIQEDVVEGLKDLGLKQRKYHEKIQKKRGIIESDDVYNENNEGFQKFELNDIESSDINTMYINDINNEANHIRGEEDLLELYKDVDNEFLPKTIRKPKKYIEKEENIYEGDEKYNQEKADNSRLVDMDSTVCICQRCFRLQQYGQVEESLRPGWSNHELLTPERFESLLKTIKDSPAVVLCIIDVFDLQGSILNNLKTIAGDNPVVIAANKVDLLPKDVSEHRLLNWIYAEVRLLCGFKSKKESENQRSYGYSNKKEGKKEEGGVLKLGNIHLVSCESGRGMTKLMNNLFTLSRDNGNSKIYVMGAANVGKSSFINRLLDNSYKGGSKGKTNKKLVPLATVSNLPGTTLDFLKIKLPNGITMIDTPGLLNSGQLTSKLTTRELKEVIPVKPINAVTLRVQEGKCVMIGGLAIVELLEGRPFFFTFFVSNEVKLHPTDAEKAKTILYSEKHIGGIVFPPHSVERVNQLGPYNSMVFEIEGEGWRQSASDIVIAGLGWVAITGVGKAKVRITVPNVTSVGVRSPLLPFEASHTTVKFTGGKLQRKTKKGAANSPGWRA